VKYPTSTAQWSLVVHRVTSVSVEVWVGTLFPTLKMPDRARVRLLDGEHELRSRLIRRTDWRRPFRDMDRRFYCLVAFRGLESGKEYRLVFERWIEARQEIGVAAHWQRLRAGGFRTLPDRLPSAAGEAFTIGFGSCFYNHRDGGRVAAAYKRLYARGDSAARPDVTMLLGDQVYLDIGFDSLSLVPGEIRERIADDYALHWQALGSMLSRGGTWMLPDDHEYWNDYPFVDSLLPALLALKLPHVRESWTRTARDGVENIQRSPVVESFALGDDLTVCLADLRSHRSEGGLLPPREFRKLLHWARHRSCPGVLVIAQPLIVMQSTAERNLRSFPSHYARLLEALAAVSHDVVVLSGDVHFGRICEVRLGGAGPRLIEVVSSPLSNLTGLDGLAANVAMSRPEKFPAPAVAAELGWEPRPVDYFRDERFAAQFFVSHIRGRLWSAYPKRRTREHFMTVGFRRLRRGVELEAEAWLARRRTSRTNLPARDFPRPFRTVLR
jgi:hypothetical protein